MGKVWFTSDPHFGHRNIISYCNRPYANVEEMNAKLIENFNSVVSNDDTAYILGDVSLGRNWVRECVPQLNGRKILIKGNHDWCHPCQAKSPGKLAKMEYEYLEAGFAEIYETLMLQVGPELVQLHHMPFFDPAESDLRYPQFRPVDNGHWLIHGHVHNAWKTRRKQINVGVDVWDYKPVAEDVLVQLIADYLLSTSRVSSATSD